MPRFRVGLVFLTVALALALPLSLPAQQNASSLGFGVRDALDYNFTPVRIFAGPIAAGTSA